MAKIDNFYFKTADEVIAEVDKVLEEGAKHHCIFEITHPNKHSECYFCKFVQDFGEDHEGADMMCESMNNFRKPDEEVWFIHRLLDQEEYDEIQEYLKQFPHGDVSNVYSPFINSVSMAIGRNSNRNNQ